LGRKHSLFKFKINAQRPNPSDISKAKKWDHPVQMNTDLIAIRTHNFLLVAENRIPDATARGRPFLCYGTGWNCWQCSPGTEQFSDVLVRKKRFGGGQTPEFWLDLMFSHSGQYDVLGSFSSGFWVQNRDSC
jgi:hypothetical protein